MPDFSAVLQRPPHPLVSRLEAAVAALLSSGSEAAALHGELTRIAAARAEARAAAELAQSCGAVVRPQDDEEAGVVSSRDSVLADGINAVFAGLTML